MATEIQGERAKVSVHKLEKLSREKHKHQIEVACGQLASVDPSLTLNLVLKPSPPCAQVHEVSFDMWDKSSRLGGHKETIVTPRHSIATA